MTKLVNLTLTDDDCLNVRMALNATAIHWGEVATAARNEGRKVDADTCERIRSDYHRLWDMVNVAQEARPADDAAPTFNDTMEGICDRLRGGPRAAPPAPDAHIADNFASHYESSNMQRP